MEPLIGTIILFAGNFAPRGWALCDGQLLPIASNQALYSVLGTIYGGDGKTTFALPDLRGRVPVQQGHGPGLSNYSLGQKGGRESVTLTVNNLPAHNHSFGGAKKEGEAGIQIDGAILGNNDNSFRDQAPDTQLRADVIGNTGGNLPVDTRPPSLGLNYIIALEGLFPSHN